MKKKEYLEKEEFNEFKEQNKAYKNDWLALAGDPSAKDYYIKANVICIYLGYLPNVGQNMKPSELRDILCKRLNDNIKEDESPYDGWKASTEELKENDPDLLRDQRRSISRYIKNCREDLKAGRTPIHSRGRTRDPKREAKLELVYQRILKQNQQLTAEILKVALGKSTSDSTLYRDMDYLKKKLSLAQIKTFLTKEKLKEVCDKCTGKEKKSNGKSNGKHCQMELVILSGYRHEKSTTRPYRKKLVLSKRSILVNPIDIKTMNGESYLRAFVPDGSVGAGYSIQLYPLSLIMSATKTTTEIRSRDKKEIYNNEELRLPEKNLFLCTVRGIRILQNAFGQEAIDIQPDDNAEPTNLYRVTFRRAHLPGIAELGELCKTNPLDIQITPVEDKKEAEKQQRLKELFLEIQEGLKKTTYLA